eukprot:PhM_4_TR14616/c4_g1_i1/m.84439
MPREHVRVARDDDGVLRGQGGGQPDGAVPVGQGLLPRDVRGPDEPAEVRGRHRQVPVGDGQVRVGGALPREPLPAQGPDGVPGTEPHVCVEHGQVRGEEVRRHPRHPHVPPGPVLPLQHGRVAVDVRAARVCVVPQPHASCVRDDDDVQVRRQPQPGHGAAVHQEDVQRPQEGVRLHEGPRRVPLDVVGHVRGPPLPRVCRHGHHVRRAGVRRHGGGVRPQPPRLLRPHRHPPGLGQLGRSADQHQRRDGRDCVERRLPLRLRRLRQARGGDVPHGWHGLQADGRPCRTAQRPQAVDERFPDVGHCIRASRA